MSETRRLAWALLGVCGVALLAFATGAHAAPDIRRRTTFAQADGVTCTFAPGQPPRCSDGRPILTARATPVPCEQQQGVWTDVPANTACVTWDGRLDAYAANTTLITFGADPSNAAWSKGTGVMVAAGPDGGWRITRTSTGGNANQTAGSPLGADATRTTACILKAPAPQPSGLLYAASTAACAFPPGPTDTWAQYSCTKALVTGNQPLSGVSITEARPLDLLGCWHVAAATPGRACFGTNASGTTCDGERHTISTSGWPTTQGYVEVVVTLGRLPVSGDTLRSLLVSETTGAALRLAGDGSVYVHDGSTGQFSTPLPWTLAPTVLRFEWSPSSFRLRMNGAVVWTGTARAMPWASVVRVASASGSSVTLDGSLSRISWSTK